MGEWYLFIFAWFDLKLCDCFDGVVPQVLVEGEHAPVQSALLALHFDVVEEDVGDYEETGLELITGGYFVSERVDLVDLGASDVQLFFEVPLPSLFFLSFKNHNRPEEYVTVTVIDEVYLHYIRN